MLKNIKISNISSVYLYVYLAQLKAALFKSVNELTKMKNLSKKKVICIVTFF